MPEVINQSGKVIWGGFGNNWTVRRVLIPKTQTSIQFNSDSTATEVLVPGEFAFGLPAAYYCVHIRCRNAQCVGRLPPRTLTRSPPGGPIPTAPCLV